MLDKIPDIKEERFNLAYHFRRFGTRLVGSRGTNITEKYGKAKLAALCVVAEEKSMTQTHQEHIFLIY